MTKLCFLLLAAALPVFAHPDHGKAPGKDSAEVVVTGNGLYTYETVPGWGALPEGANVGPTHGGVAVSEAGTVFVSTDAGHGIVVINKDGTFKGYIKQTKIHSLMINKEGDKEYLYAAQLGKSRFIKMDLDGKIVLEISEKVTGKIKGGYGGLTAATVAPNGDIYISMGYGSNLVHRFDSTGKHLASMGGKDKNRSRAQYSFVTPHGVAIDKRFGEPRLLVVDREQGRLVHYTLEMKFIGEYATHLRRPCSVSFHNDLCAVAELAGRATVIAKSGAPVAFLGDNPNKKQRASFGVKKEDLKVGFFTAPHGISFDNDGNIIVQDWNRTGRVTMLKHRK